MPFQTPTATPTPTSTPTSTLGAAKYLDARFALRHEHVFFQAAEPHVMGELLAAVIAFGPFGEHLEDQRRIAQRLTDDPAAGHDAFDIDGPAHHDAVSRPFSAALRFVAKRACSIVPPAMS